MSMPFFGQRFTFTNPDGSKLSVVGWGDQFHAHFETPEGYTVVRNPATGFYEYAHLSPDANALVANGIRADEAPPTALRKHLRMQPAARRSASVAAQAALGPKPRWQIRREEHRQTLIADAARGVPRAVPAPPQNARVGSYVGLCVLVQFPDVAGTITQAQINDFCNQQGYTGFGNNGSVRDYYADNSGGRLTYTNVVTAYYTAAHNRAYYTDRTVGYGIRARELIREAIASLQAQHFNFDQLSVDGSGAVYALNVFYAGDVVNNWSEGLWPHSSTLSPQISVSATRKLADYQITNIGSSLTLGTFCHENGHMLCDYPDLYDYGYESNGAGGYCLMAFGGGGTNPVQIGAYLKYKSGWANPATAVGPGRSTVRAGVNQFYLHRNPAKATEYFIIENRQKLGRDANLPDAGLAVWHIDETGSNSNEQMTPTQHYECALVQADNRFDLEHKANFGDANDLFAAPLQPKLGAASAPNSNWWDGAASGLEITDVSTSDANMSFNAAGFQHLSPIAGHAMQADLDFTTLAYPAKFAVVADFDGDGRDEIAVAPEASASAGNDLWVARFVPASRTWQHVSPIAGHPMQADLDATGLGYPAKLGLAGDFDGDKRAELLLVPQAAGSAGNDCWVMKFDTAGKTWRHLSPIAGHAMQADLDASGLGYPIKFGVVGDFDGDGRYEVAFAPDAPTSAGNDFWVMKFDVASKSWKHLSPIAGHPMQADFDCSGLGYPAKLAVAGDFDGDGRAEIAVVPAAGGSAGNDIWVMKFDTASKTWKHLSPIAGHPMQADIDCSGLGYPVKFAVVGDFDGDGRPEIAFAPEASGSAGNDIWVMKFDTASKTWKHLSPIAGHPMQADIDCSGLGYPVKFAVVGDFDGDGRPEIAFAPEASGSAGNDIWVMKFDTASKTWKHLSPIAGHPMQADVDFSTLGYPAKFAVAGDFDGDKRHELAVAPQATGSPGNDFWVTKYVG